MYQYLRTMVEGAVSKQDSNMSAMCFVNEHSELFSFDIS